MCLTAEAFAVFLNLIALPDVTMEPGRIILHADARDAVWVAMGDHWCTTAPQDGRAARFDG